MSDKVFTPADIQVALKERLVKFEVQLRELHDRELRKDQPGFPANAPPEQPIGSSHGIPQGQLQDLCPMCGQPDMPGQCQCLNGGGNEGLDQGVSDPNANQSGQQESPLALSEDGSATCSTCGDGYNPKAKGEDLTYCEVTGECHQKKKTTQKPAEVKKGADFIDIKGKTKTIGNHPDAVLPDDKKPKKVKSAEDEKVKKGKGLAKAGQQVPSEEQEPEAKPEAKKRQPLDTGFYTPDFAGGGRPRVPGGGTNEPPKVDDSGKRIGEIREDTSIPKDDFIRALQQAAAGRVAGTGREEMNAPQEPFNVHIRNQLQAKQMADQALGKVAVPMAKPPSGGTGLAPKPPAIAQPAVPKVGAPGAAPKALGKHAINKAEWNETDSSSAASGVGNSGGGLGTGKPPPLPGPAPGSYMHERNAKLAANPFSPGLNGNPKAPGLGKAGQPMSPKDKKMMQTHAASDAYRAAVKPAEPKPEMTRKPPEWYDPKGGHVGGDPAKKGEEKPTKSFAAQGTPGFPPKVSSKQAGMWSPRADTHPHDIKAMPNTKPLARPSGVKISKGELSKSMGVCLFCGNGEHPGMCGLAKNIQTSLNKVASPILQAQPKLKAPAGKLGHVATSPELGDVQGPAGKTSGAPALPPQAGTVAGSPNRAKPPDVRKRLPPTGAPAIKGK